MSEPGSKFGSSSPPRPRPRSPVRMPTTRPPETSSLRAAVSRDERRASLLRALREPGADLRDRRDVVAVVPHRRRSRKTHRPLGGQVVEALALDARPERHVLAVHSGEELSEGARVHDGAGEEVRAGCLALLDDRHGDLAQPLADSRVLLEKLVQPDRCREAGRAPSDDEDADVDALIRRIGGLGDELGRAERRREVRGTNAHDPLFSLTSSVSLGTISCTSPTTARSEYSKIGAFGSLLMATMVPEPCMPTLCWIAPEIPHAM